MVNLAGTKRWSLERLVCTSLALGTAGVGWYFLGSRPQPLASSLTDVRASAEVRPERPLPAGPAQMDARARADRQSPFDPYGADTVRADTREIPPPPPPPADAEVTATDEGESARQERPVQAMKEGTDAVTAIADLGLHLKGIVELPAGGRQALFTASDRPAAYFALAAGEEWTRAGHTVRIQRIDSRVVVLVKDGERMRIDTDVLKGLAPPVSVR